MRDSRKAARRRREEEKGRDKNKRTRRTIWNNKKYKDVESRRSEPEKQDTSK